MNGASDRFRTVANGLMGAATLSYVVSFMMLSWWKFATFHSTGFDLAIFVREIWGIRSGDLSLPTMNRFDIFSDHFVPILWAVAPLARWFPIAGLLLFLQTLALALTGWILFRCALKEIPSLAALAVGIAFFLHPSVQNANLFEFHCLSLALPFLALFLWLREEHPYLATLALVVALTAREEVAGVLLIWGFVQARKRKAFGIGLGAVSVMWVAVALALKARESNLWHEQIGSAARFAGWQAAKALLVRSEGLFALLGGLGFFSIFGWRRLLWIVIPGAFFLFGFKEEFGLVQYHHLAFFVPFLVLAALPFLGGPRANVRAALLLICSCAVNWMYTTAPWGRNSTWKYYREGGYSAEARQVLGLIGPEESVVAPIRILAHVADRKWPFWQVVAGPDAVILEKIPRRGNDDTDEDYRMRKEAMGSIASDMIARFGYRIRFEGPNLLLLRKDSGGSPPGK
jgi:hypothetical protein